MIDRGQSRLCERKESSGQLGPARESGWVAGEGRRAMFTRDRHIVWLEISVDNSAAVEIGHGRAELL